MHSNNWQSPTLSWAALIERVGPFGLRVKSTHSPFEALLEAILYQQLHANAAKAILGRLLAGFGDIHPQPEQLLAAPEEMLRAAGLSRSKLLSLRDLAAKTLDGTVPSLAAIRRLSDEEIIERLGQVRGIGTWTAEMLLIFRLGRPDVFPATDYGIRKGYLLTFGGSRQASPLLPICCPSRNRCKRGRRAGSHGARWPAGTCGGPASCRPCDPPEKSSYHSCMSDQSTPAERYICVHGHFYQPPRENPWLETVETEDSAAPYHDWNERITAECYAPNGASRIVNGENQIIRIMNNYSRISFNFGPTLLSWLEENAPRTYRMIRDADRQSMLRYDGHGSALAQVYNHVIMPLANTRDRVTQIRWGIADFQHRFGRAPEGMWLSETAVDTETLDLLAQNGILFTILAPHQCARVRERAESTLQPALPDSTAPARAG